MFDLLGEKLAKFKQYVIWLYSLYELNTQISICEPWEKVFCNVLLGSCVSIILYATYAYVPGYCLMLASFILPTAMNANSIKNNIMCTGAEDMCYSSESESYLT
ncbi:CG34194 [Drosophila busckii]|uniref:Serine palmitoyltransferase small subunit B n=1 Tax=Drosophila busckii TaxID=30019 RepID=A0A0M5J7A9_DROBS|nr:CG34194 [Drosophila busckii]